jgi:hypothetical protein
VCLLGLGCGKGGGALRLSSCLFLGTATDNLVAAGLSRSIAASSIFPASSSHSPGPII